MLTWWSEKGIPYVGYIKSEDNIEYKKQYFRSKSNFFKVQKVDKAKIELNRDAWDE